MHYTGTIWRPPYEANSLLLEVTAGCTHHKCKFCTLYEDLPFPFRMSPLEDIEADLLEVQIHANRWERSMASVLQGRSSEEAKIKRVFLVGANPFAIQFARLKKIALLIRQYVPTCESIGCFARVTDIIRKTDAELEELCALGFDGITIGVETGDDVALAFMNKGYPAAEIIAQSHRLDAAGIGYFFFYLAGISGAGRGEEGALASAAVFNQVSPKLIGSSMLTVYPESELYREIQAGNWQEAGELEKLEELKTLIGALEIPVQFAALGASNAVMLHGRLPMDKEDLLTRLDTVCQTWTEETLRNYRENLPHL